MKAGLLFLKFSYFSQHVVYIIIQAALFFTFRADFSSYTTLSPHVLLGCVNNFYLTYVTSLCDLYLCKKKFANINWTVLDCRKAKQYVFHI